ncbi:uncharacterized protein TNCV_2305491 [Trichonephila clavipes]|nr:uncharacterized protein TNCV_2305491 [Trichonephila clavipes]
MQRFPGAIFQLDNAWPHTARVSHNCLALLLTFLGLYVPKFVSNQAYMELFGMVSWVFHEFERTRGKVKANMERNVSIHHTELVCLKVRSYRIEHLR